MSHLPQLPRVLAGILPAIALCSIASSQAQNTDGFTLQERPGIVLVKPQPWSKDSDATVVEFKAFIDRTASGAGGAGYYEFHNKQGDKRQVVSPKVVKLIVYPDPKLIKEVVQPADKETIQATITELNAVIAKYPATKSYLDPSLKSLSGEIALYDSGKVKTDGTWIAKETFIRGKANELVELLKGDISRADPPSSFDLEHDPRFLALKEFSNSSPAIKSQVADLSTTYGKLVRTEKRKAVVSRILSNPTLPYKETSIAFEQLKALKPEEEPAVARLVKSWDAGDAAAKAAAEEATPLAIALESEMAAVKTDNVPPKLSADLDQKISALNDKMNQFSAAKFPPQLAPEVRQAQAVCETANGFKKLTVFFQDKQYLNGKDILDPLSRQASSLGPETSRVIASLQRTTASKIEEFTKLREEGNLLVGAGKNAEALVKYEDAYTVIPDPTVGDTIAKLKSAAPPPPAKK